VKEFEYQIQVSWENEDGTTDFDNFSVTAENVEQAKVLAFADCEMPNRFDLEINSIFVRVE